jgi:hypothetical protein
MNQTKPTKPKFTELQTIPTELMVDIGALLLPHSTENYAKDKQCRVTLVNHNEVQGMESETLPFMTS